MIGYTSIARAIEEKVIDEIYDRIDWLNKNHGDAEGQRVVNHVADYLIGDDVTPDYVSGLLWELIEAGKIDIDQYGMVTIAHPAD